MESQNILRRFQLQTQWHCKKKIAHMLRFPSVVKLVLIILPDKISDSN